MESISMRNQCDTKTGCKVSLKLDHRDLCQLQYTGITPREIASEIDSVRHTSVVGHCISIVRVLWVQEQRIRGRTKAWC